MIKEWEAKPLHSEFGTKPLVYYTPHAARLSGTVVNQKTGQVVPGASISLQPGDDTHPAVTDAEGVFFFWNLKVGTTHSMNIAANGFSAIKRKIHLDEEYIDLGKILIS